jgi:hypothetical protein
LKTDLSRSTQVQMTKPLQQLLHLGITIENQTSNQTITSIAPFLGHKFRPRSVTLERRSFTQGLTTRYPNLQRSRWVAFTRLTHPEVLNRWIEERNQKNKEIAARLEQAGELNIPDLDCHSETTTGSRRRICRRLILNPSSYPP